MFSLKHISLENSRFSHHIFISSTYYWLLLGKVKKKNLFRATILKLSHEKSVNLHPI